MENIGQWLPLLVPFILLELTLKVVALLDLARRERARGPKWAWILAIVFVNFLGSVLYFLLGREE